MPPGRALLLALLLPAASACARLEAAAPAYRLRCSLESGEVLLLRVDPGRQELQRLHGSSGEVLETIRSEEPPPGLGGGIIDDSTVRELMRGRTTLMVMHRLSTAHRFDRIVVLEHGRVVEAGTGSDLLARGGTYAKMFAADHYEL